MSNTRPSEYKEPLGSVRAAPSGVAVGRPHRGVDYNCPPLEDANLLIMPESILDIMPVDQVNASPLVRYLYSLEERDNFASSLRKSYRYLKDEYYFVVPL